jgi:hypothetical protein
MPLFQVMRRPHGTSDPHTESGAVFIRDRFSWSAALFTPVWMLYEGLILETGIWFVGVLVLGGISAFFDNPAIWLAYPGIALLVGFEAPNILVAGLRRRGFTPVGDIVANSADLAEMEWMKRGATV